MFLRGIEAGSYMMTRTFFGKKIKVSTTKIAVCTDFSTQLVTCSRKYDHKTPPLKDLYWLPVAHCIRFKIQDTFKSLRNLIRHLIFNIYSFIIGPCTRFGHHLLNAYLVLIKP